MTQDQARLLGISQRRDAANASRERGRSARGPGAPQARAGGLAALRYGSAALALIVASAATACTGGGSTGSLLNTGKASGTLTVATPSAPSSLDPAVGQPADETFSDFAYTPLIVQASNGSYTPGLAESWSYGPDNESFTINLRSGVKFSDGTALNAAGRQDLDPARDEAGQRRSQLAADLQVGRRHRTANADPDVQQPDAGR